MIVPKITDGSFYARFWLRVVLVLLLTAGCGLTAILWLLYSILEAIRRCS